LVITFAVTSGEGIVSLGVRLSRYHAVCVRRISLGGEGNALYPVLSSSVIYFSIAVCNFVAGKQ